MPAARLVGVGASAGGVEALREFVTDLGPLLGAGDAAVLLVLHQPARSPTVLPRLLSDGGRLPVAHAEHAERPQAGHVYVAPPDQHLQVDGGAITLTRGPKENGHRPSIDVMLCSVARDAGARAVGVILSGMLDDGAAGLLEVVRHGGVALVQDPDDAPYDGMPRAALAAVPDAVVRPIATLAPALAELLGSKPRGGAQHEKGRR